ncbi:MAG: hypothetical protein JO320_25210 [Alphaproteobacteria bacterium]|nr:hypothetical protein [Alphaproteobacteria bacterium]
MRSTVIAALAVLSLAPAAALAQTAPQIAAAESTAAAPSAPAGSGGITRDQFIQRAKDRAAQRAATRFDQMDTDHDGVLDRAELRAWRNQHPRHAATQPTATQAPQPTAQ